MWSWCYNIFGFNQNFKCFGYIITPIFLFSNFYLICNYYVDLIAFTYFPMSRILLRLNVVESISMNLNNRTRSKGFTEKVKMSLPFRIAIRSLRTRKSETLRIMIASMLCMMLVSILIFGGQTISATASNYIEKGIGEDVFLVAKPKIAENYIRSLSFYPSETEYIDSENPWQSNEINERFIEWLQTQPS